MDGDGNPCVPPGTPAEAPAPEQPAVILPGNPTDPVDPGETDPGETDPGEEGGEDPDPTAPDPDETPLPEPEIPDDEESTEPTPAPSPPPGKPDVEVGPSKPGGKITRPEVISRAVSWVVQKVPYSQVRWWSDENGRYRQDCSGMVSMAWHLSQKTNYWTGNLATVSRRIPSNSLKPGDILLRPRQHTLIFAGWANEQHTRFNLYEEYARGKPARYALNASLNHYLSRGFGAYRYKNIVESGVNLQLVSQDGAKDTVDLAGAATDVLPAVPGVPGVRWTPATAGYEPEVAAPAAPAGVRTPPSAPEVAVDTLVAAQRALDDAVLEAGRLGTEAESASTGTYLVVAGLGLAFLAFPLGMGMRAGAWSASAVPARREVESTEGPATP